VTWGSGECVSHTRTGCCACIVKVPREGVRCCASRRGSCSERDRLVYLWREGSPSEGGGYRRNNTLNNSVGPFLNGGNSSGASLLTDCKSREAAPSNVVVRNRCSVRTTRGHGNGRCCRATISKEEFHINCCSPKTSYDRVIGSVVCHCGKLNGFVGNDTSYVRRQGERIGQRRARDIGEERELVRDAPRVDGERLGVRDRQRVCVDTSEVVVLTHHGVRLHGCRCYSRQRVCADADLECQSWAESPAAGIVRESSDPEPVEITQHRINNWVGRLLNGKSEWNSAAHEDDVSSAIGNPERGPITSKSGGQSHSGRISRRL
jgi:hypothetical protein